MKGKLLKTKQGWMVEYLIHPVGRLNENKKLVNLIPLHPFDIEQIKMYSQIFDYLEARIKAYPDVEFTIIPVSDSNNIVIGEFAKLKQ